MNLKRFFLLICFGLIVGQPRVVFCMDYRELMDCLAHDRGILEDVRGVLVPQAMEFKPFEFGAEGPVAKASQSSRVEVGRTEVTQLEFYLVMGRNPSRFVLLDSPDYLKVDGVGLNINRPVETVSMVDVQEYIHRVNSQSNSYTYRLLTSNEWDSLSKSEVLSLESKNPLLTDRAIVYENSKLKTAFVASKNPSELGIYDLIGNVWEWSSVSSDVGFGLIKGGSFLDSASQLKSSLSMRWPAETITSMVGFRLARIPN